VSTKRMFLFTFEQATLQLHPFSQSMKHFNQNVKTGSRFSSSKYTNEEWVFNMNSLDNSLDCF